MIELDGNYGEGGGQIVRSALALSTLLGKPFEISNIRKGRSNPGLKAQHLSCITALKDMCDPEVEGAVLGSDSLTYTPKKYDPKTVKLDIGTAGSITLLLQCLLFPASLSKQKSRFVITGGTDVKWSMQMDYLINIVLPQLKRFATVSINVEKRGYYPKGQGKVDVNVHPKFMDDVAFLPSLDLTKQKKLICIRGTSHASKELSKAEVAERQARAAQHILSKYNVPVNIQTIYSETECTGTGITLWALFGQDDLDLLNPIILGSDNLGEKGKKAELVGEECAKALIDEISTNAPVDKHLADNLIPYMGVFGGKIKVSEITNHTLTNIYVTEQFLDVKFNIDEEKKIISVEK
ncbi:RNA 3'-terminal phosphate cyclase [Candidatus Woesearchaeota archaeon]|jgi:RNA 3'-phosphate cyclase|nr:RNA 3'-terminal phosphate cyclase [Candidatus Woesearchaeota archaeon]MBT7928778.1 RNA 3'-terminal phosphate cyclase [Candidatus Peregrinibacteria bacterium]MBT3537622.1 RNA 3'-terminal phosphate cyclase [Candidatus Woesearchaeota archaeon]MBT4698444.1 RNA 3'-terminal phosphate cyclase [Candidatus Woesearchaeota archaeon]MBT4716647.1 RNA 3'-terminal phosphate cyclase [Candidatus Woesearchaeota archaeon]